MNYSARKVRNQIDKLRLDPLIQPFRTPILLSDSKGLNLRNQVRVNPESFIEFWCQTGATAENRLQYLRDNLATKLQAVPNIALYVWVGTCNLTSRNGDFIQLTARDNSATSRLISTLRDIYHFVRTFDNNQIKLVFLRIPIYSISEYNVYNGYSGDIAELKYDDRLLAQQIEQVNFFIEDTNRLLHAYSPKFSQDLQKSRSSLRRGRRTTYSWDFTLLRDGLHPTNDLAKLWLIRLTHLVHNDCY